MEWKWVNHIAACGNECGCKYRNDGEVWCDSENGDDSAISGNGIRDVRERKRGGRMSGYVDHSVSGNINGCQDRNAIAMRMRMIF